MASQRIPFPQPFGRRQRTYLPLGGRRHGGSVVSDRRPVAPLPGERREHVRGWGSWGFRCFAQATPVRGASLIPGIPVVGAGAALFPDRASLVLLVSIAGGLASAALLYRFPGSTGYDKMLAAKYTPGAPVGMAFRRLITGIVIGMVPS